MALQGPDGKIIADIVVTENNISTKDQVATQEQRIVNGQNFVSIQNEIRRHYNFGERGTATIESPQWLFVRPSGAHTVISPKGTHYIPKDFIELIWEKKPGTDAAEF